MVHELLSDGIENAKTGRTLCNALGISSRDLMAQVEIERRAGHPICASTGRHPGYYMAANKKEMKDYCSSLYRRAGNIFKTRRACLNTVDSLPEE